MTINATASILLLLYALVAEAQGVERRRAPGTIQNDILKEYIARGTYIYPPRPSMRLIDRHVRVLRRADPALEHDLDQRLPHPRGGLDRGAGGRLHARRRDRVRARPRSRAGSRSTPSAPGCPSSSTRTTTSSRRWRSSGRRAGCGRGSCASASARRTASRSRFASTPRRAARRSRRSSRRTTSSASRSRRWRRSLGGTQSLHTNRYDEALALPTEERRTIALRTQQILAAGGRRRRHRRSARRLVRHRVAHRRDRGARRELIGGSTSRAARSRPSSRASCRSEIEQAAFEFQQQVEAGERVIVGVNKFEEEAGEPHRAAHIDPAVERRQLERTALVRAERNAENAVAAIAAVREAARRREPARDARGAACALHRRRGRGAARGVGDVRRGPGAGLARPPTGHDLAVALLGDGCAEGDEGHSIQYRLEVAHRRRRARCPTSGGRARRPRS